MILEPPLFPHRDWIDDDARARAAATMLGGSAAMWRLKGPIRALEYWVAGGSFHRYGVAVLHRLSETMDAAAAVDAFKEPPPRLEIHGDLDSSQRLRWSVRYQRAGDPESWGLSSGASCPDDAAYSALTMIEDEEREEFLRTAPVGLA